MLLIRFRSSRNATMEPMNCTVHVYKDGCEVWVGNQVLARAQAAAAKTTGLPMERVVVHNHLIGGGFGRRLEIDGVTRAVEIARHVDGPVKVVWTREEDIQHDMYRPYFFDRISAGLDENGKPVAWNNRFAGSSVIARWVPPLSTMVSTPTPPKAQSTWPMPSRTCVSSICGLNPRPFRLPLAQCRTLAQCLRDRKLHGRTGGGGQARPGRLSAGSPRQGTPR